MNTAGATTPRPLAAPREQAAQAFRRCEAPDAAGNQTPSYSLDSYLDTMLGLRKPRHRDCRTYGVGVPQPNRKAQLSSTSGNQTITTTTTTVSVSASYTVTRLLASLACHTHLYIQTTPNEYPWSWMDRLLSVVKFDTSHALSTPQHNHY